MTANEYELWLELRRKEHEKRGAAFRGTCNQFDGLHARVAKDEPKQSPAVRALDKAADKLRACRWPLEDIAAHDTGDNNFALKAFAAHKPGEPAPAEKEPRPDEWLDGDCWWSSAQAEKLVRADRDALVYAARAGKIGVRAAKHGLEYRARDVTRFVDGHL